MHIEAGRWSISVVLRAMVVHGMLHILLELIGRIAWAHGEVGPRRDGRWARRLNLRLCLRSRRNRLRRLRCCLRRCLLLRWRRCWRRLLIHLLESLFIDKLPVRRQLGRNPGMGFAQSVRRQIEVSEIFALLDDVEWVDDLRHLEDVCRNPGEGREEQNVKEKSEPESLPQARPAALVLEVADHLQQFVSVVIHPARATNDRRTGAVGFERPLRVQGQSQKSTGDRGLCLRTLRALVDRRIWGRLCGSLRIGLFDWRLAGGHSMLRNRSRRRFRHTRNPGSPFESFLSILSFCLKLVSYRRLMREQYCAPVQWFLLN